MKTGVLLVNLGTPDSPKIKDVRKYLREFLMDDRVIDIPYLTRTLLVNLIIAPFRAPRSAAIYRKLWLESGSPLMVYGELLVCKLQKELGNRYVVRLAMRYQSPSIKEGLDSLKRENVKELVIVPLFPQYASATTGSVIEKVFIEMRHWQNFPAIRIVHAFYNNPGFIQAIADKGKVCMKDDSWDHILFSYHGLPERQIFKASDGYCNFESCCNCIGEKNFRCYRAQCFETSRLLARALDLGEEDYSVVFQSRLGNVRWIQPYAKNVIKNLPEKGIKRVLIFCPSFIADCLETTIEVGEEFRDLFLDSGGEKWQLVEGLNDSLEFTNILQELIHIPSNSNPLDS